MKIGKTLKALRLKRNMTLDCVAGATNLSVSYISCLERDKRNINFSTLGKVAKALNTPLPIIVFLSASDDDLNNQDKTLMDFKSALAGYVLDK